MLDQLPQNLEKPRKLPSHSLPIPPSYSTQELLETFSSPECKNSMGSHNLRTISAETCEKAHSFSPGFSNRASALKSP